MVVRELGSRPFLQLAAHPLPPDCVAVLLQQNLHVVSPSPHPLRSRSLRLGELDVDNEMCWKDEVRAEEGVERGEGRRGREGRYNNLYDHC